MILTDFTDPALIKLSERSMLLFCLLKTHRNLYFLQTFPPSSSSYVLAADPSPSPPTEPHPFPVAAPAAPRGPLFPSTVQPFPQQLWSSQPPHPTPTSNKRCRSPVCCYSGEACSHGRPAHGQLRALCIHEALQHTASTLLQRKLSKLQHQAAFKSIVVHVIIHIWGFLRTQTSSLRLLWGFTCSFHNDKLLCLPACQSRDFLVLLNMICLIS